MWTKDKLLFIAYAGAISAILANLFLYAVNAFLPPPTINMPELTSELFLNIDPNGVTVFERVLGFLWSLVVGGVYTAFCFCALEITGWEHISTKCIVVVTALWVLGAGFVMRLLGLGAYVRDAPQAILAFYVAHVFFAAVLSLFFARWSAAKSNKN